MAITIDPATHIIFIPRADLTLIQSNPTEIRELDLNWFRLQLKSIEDSEDGMYLLKTHNHNAEVNVGGLTLARVVSILDPYTVTFEPSAYAVNLTGANSNVGDKVNVNQVSVRSFNSAGLISSPAIEYASFNGGVTIDMNCSYSGTLYPIGTPRLPVNNIADALLIAEYRGFPTFYITGDITLNTGTDFDEMVFVGESKTKSVITIDANADVENCEFYDAEITGTLDGGNVLKNCLIGNINYVNGYVEQCVLKTGTITLGGIAEAHFLDCWSGVVGTDTPIIDMGGSGQGLGMRNYNGGIKLINKTGPEKVSIDLNSGHVILDSTVTNGEIVIRGIGILTDNSNGAVIHADDLVNRENVASGVWSECLSGYSTGAGKVQQLQTYDGYVRIDTVNGFSGTAFPIGTYNKPSNNLTDALIICNNNNIGKIRLRSDLVIGATHNINNMSIESRGIMGTDVTFTSGCSANNAAFRYLNLQGTISNTDTLLVENCSIGNLVNFTGIMNTATFGQGNEISIGTWANFISCHAGGETGNEPEINIGTGNLNINKYTGNLKLKGKTGSDRTVANFQSGNVIVDSTCIAGTIQILGVGVLEDNSGAGCTVDDEAALTIDNMTHDIWSENTAGYVVDGTFGSGITQILGLSHHNVHIDHTEYDSDSNLTSARLRTYSDINSVGTGHNIIETYKINSVGSGAGMFTSWSSVVSGG